MVLRYHGEMKRTGYLRIGIAVLVLALVLMAAGYWYVSYRTSVKDTTMPAVGTYAAFRYEIADTPAKQELGLGKRPTIEDNYGMMFVFPKADRYGFWMKDMLAPIDIIWLSDNGTVILIDHGVDPGTYPHVFYPPTPVKYVLETRAGYARDHGLEVDSKIALPPPYGN